MLDLQSPFLRLLCARVSVCLSVHACVLGCVWCVCVCVRSVMCDAAGSIEGDVRVSGHPKVQKTFARVMGYVEQTDIHSPNVSTLPLPPNTLPSLCLASNTVMHILPSAKPCSNAQTVLLHVLCMCGMSSLGALSLLQTHLHLLSPARFWKWVLVASFDSQQPVLVPLVLSTNAA